MIRTLSSEELAERWSEIKPEIERAIEHGIGESTAHDMFVGAMNHTYECWEVLDNTGKTVSVGFVRINRFEQHNQLQVVTTAGEGWDEYGPSCLDFIESTAKQLGCKYVTIWGRPGWYKKLKKYGYENTYTVLSKEIK